MRNEVRSIVPAMARGLLLRTLNDCARPLNTCSRQHNFQNKQAHRAYGVRLIPTSNVFINKFKKLNKTYHCVRHKLQPKLGTFPVPPKEHCL